MKGEPMAKAKPTRTGSVSDQVAKPPKRKPRAKQDSTSIPTIQGVPMIWQPNDGTTPTSDTVSVHCAKKQERENNSQEQPSSEPSSQTPPDIGSADPVSIDSNTRKANTQEEPQTDTDQEQSTPLAAKPDQKQATGGVPSTGAKSATECDGSTLTDGPIAHARHGETRGMCWERLRKEARAAGMARGQGPGTAYEWATRETDRLFPAPLPPVPEPEPEPIADEPISIEPEAIPEPELPTAADKPAADSLVFVVPESWPELPDNASLQAEIAWVSANRLRVRDGSGVDLSRAKTPAPSYSALSWLETSILFPSKFADISVKATANQDDEKELIRREKASIEEIRSILAEMLED